MKFLAALALAALASFAHAQAGDLVTLQARAVELNDQCRGGSGDQPATQSACRARDHVMRSLETRGLCYNPRSATPAAQWVRCVPRDVQERQDNLRALADQFNTICNGVGAKAAVARGAAIEGIRPPEAMARVVGVRTPINTTQSINDEELVIRAYTTWRTAELTPAQAGAAARMSCRFRSGVL